MPSSKELRTPKNKKYFNINPGEKSPNFSLWDKSHGTYWVKTPSGVFFP